MPTPTFRRCCSVGSRCARQFLLELTTLLWVGLGAISIAHAQTYSRIYGWGDNGVGQLGNGTTSQYSVPAMTELYGKTLIAVASGAAHSLALGSDGTIYAWGYNGLGQLGNNSTADSLVPIVVNTTNGVSALYGKTVIAIAAGDNFSLALASDGTVYSWGQNGTMGKLGNNSTAPSSVPVAVDTSGVLAGKTITAISAGNNHALVLDSTGKVYAWGINYNTNNNEVIGQLGDGSSAQYSRIPVAVDTSGVLAGKTVTAIGAGFFHSMACTSDGKLYAWGGNYNGMLGEGSTTKSYVPVAVNMSGALAGKSVIAVAMGYVHSLCLASDGTVYGWGFGYNGTNGNGSSTETHVPVAVDTSGVLAGKTITAITAGYYHCVALASDGKVYTWGANFGGALGNNSSSNSNVPVAVNTTSGLSALAGATVQSLGRSSIGNTLVIASSSALGAPDAPINASATASDHQVIVSFTPPPSTGGSTITSYTVTASPGGATQTGPSGPFTFSGLTNGVEYTFTVTATNALGTSVDSAVSPTATPPVPYAFSTFAGSGAAGLVNGTGTATQFTSPYGIAVDSNTGNIFVTDAVNHVIRMITNGQAVTTWAGTGSPGSTDGTGTAASFNSPMGVAVDNFGRVYVADSGNNLIRMISDTGVVTTLAGSGTPGSTNGIGTAAEFNNPMGVAIDSDGVIYVADTGNHKIRAIATDGTVTTFAGSGANSFRDATGTSARFSNPTGVAVDSANNVYVADSGNHLIRKITPSRGVTTYAGNQGYTGSTDETGTLASFNNPTGVAVDNGDNVYVADRDNHKIRKITPDRAVTTVAGLGTSGSVNGLAAVTSFNNPTGIAVDSVRNLYVADFSNEKIRFATAAAEFALTSATTASASTGTGFSYQVTFATTPTLFTATGLPAGLSINSSTGAITGSPTVVGTFNIIVGGTTMTGEGVGTLTVTIAKGAQATLSVSSSASGMLSTPYTATAGGGSGTGAITWSLGTGSTAAGAAINSSSGAVTSTGTGTVVIKASKAADANYLAATSADFTITVFAPYLFTTFAGSPGLANATDGISSAARFHSPDSIAVDSSGNLYVVDQFNNTIRKITPSGVVTTLAGLAGQTGSTDATGSAARFNEALGVAVDSSGHVYVADQSNHTIRKITPAGAVTTLAGLANNSGTTDATGTAARFNSPVGVAVDASGNVYVSDNGNYLVRKITSGGVVTTLAGSVGNPGSTDDTGTAAQFQSPSGLAVDSAGNVYVADYVSIRKITAGGVVTTLAGSSSLAGTTDDAGTLARFDTPFGVAVDSTGNVYVADAANNTIRMITPSGVVTTLAGLGGSSADSVDGTGSIARFSTPFGVAVDSTGYIYVADFGNQTIRKGHLAFAPSFTTHPANQTVAVGTQVTFTATAMGWPAPTLQWQKGGVNIGGATDTSYTVSSPVVSDAATYRVIATNSVDSTTSNGATLTVNQAAQAGLTITSSSAGTFGSAYTATATGGTGTGALVWSLGTGSTAAGAAINSSNGAVTSTGAGTVVINAYRATDTNYLVSATTADFTITLAKVAQSTVSITSSSSSTFNSSYTATATGGTGSGALIWALGTGSTAAGAAIDSSSGAVTSTGAGTVVINAYRATDTNYLVSATTADFIITLEKAAGTVTLGGLTAFYDGSSHSASATTSPTSLTVTFTYNGSATPPISAGTYSVIGTINDTSYQGTASGSLVISKVTPTITWTTPAGIQFGTALGNTQLNATANIPGSFTYSPASGTVLSPGIQTLNTTFSPADPANCSEATAQQTLTVTSLPSFSSQPADRTIGPGQNTTFLVIASGYPSPTYQWQLLPAGSSTWIDLTNGGSYSGATATTLLVSNTVLIMNGDQFRCIATNTIGAVASNAGLLTVTTATIAPSEATITFTVE